MNICTRKCSKSIPSLLHAKITSPNWAMDLRHLVTLQSERIASRRRPRSRLCGEPGFCTHEASLRGQMFGSNGCEHDGRRRTTGRWVWTEQAKGPHRGRGIWAFLPRSSEMGCMCRGEWGTGAARFGGRGRSFRGRPAHRISPVFGESRSIPGTRIHRQLTFAHS